MTDDAVFVVHSTLRVLHVTGIRFAIPVVLIHRRGAFQGGATRALMAMLSTWPKPG
jgi:hypothetical protein